MKPVRLGGDVMGAAGSPHSAPIARAAVTECCDHRMRLAPLSCKSRSSQTTPGAAPQGRAQPQPRLQKQPQLRPRRGPGAGMHRKLHPQPGRSPPCAPESAVATVSRVSFKPRCGIHAETQIIVSIMNKASISSVTPWRFALGSQGHGSQAQDSPQGPLLALHRTTAVQPPPLSLRPGAPPALPAPPLW